MPDSKLHTCCFFGHRKILVTDEMESKLYNEIENLILNEEINVFLFGSRSEFDSLCHKVVSRLKRKYTHVKRIYVRAEFPEINNSYKEYLSDSYEDTYYPEKITGAGKAVYIERNREMIEKSCCCICYCDENYGTLSGKTIKSGTSIAIAYAKKKGLRIQNIK